MPSSTTSSRKLPELDLLTLKQLAQEIESSGKTRRELSLVSICDESPNIFGDSASDKRRAVQKKFDLLKRKTPQSYRNWLDNVVKVAPGAALEREIREAEEYESDASSESDNTGSISSESSDSGSARKKSKPTPAPRVSRPAPRVSTPPAAIIGSPPRAMPPQEITVGSPPFASPPSASLATMSTQSSNFAQLLDGMKTLTTDFANVVDRIKMLECIKMDGSNEHPYIVMMDASKPEGNFGFEVSEVNGVEHDNFVRDIFHIRKVTTASQEHLFEATIPFEKYPGLAHRAVLIRGPSQDHFHRKAELNHQVEYCQKTKTVHETLETDISNSPERQYSHWLLVFPNGTELENHIFSGDAVHVKRESNDLVDGLNLDGEELELLATDVYWRIAKKGGKLIRRAPGASKKGRFANRKKAAVP